MIPRIITIMPMTPRSEALIIQSDMYNLVEFYVPDDQLSARHKESSNRSLRLVVTLVKHLSIANTMPINGFAYGIPHKKKHIPGWS